MTSSITALNKDILAAKNPYFKAKQKGFVLTTPRADSIEAAPLSSLFPKGHYISLVEVLHTINQRTDFLDTFEHWQQHSRMTKPSDRTFFAGIMATAAILGLIS